MRHRMRASILLTSVLVALVALALPTPSHAQSQCDQPPQTTATVAPGSATLEACQGDTTPPQGWLLTIDGVDYDLGPLSPQGPSAGGLFLYTLPLNLPSPGTYYVSSAAYNVDSTGTRLIARAPSPIAVTVQTTPPPPPSETSIFSGTPAQMDGGDASPMEAGVRFKADMAGTVTGVRFYKGTSANGGTHVGSLWTNSGTLLARATFTNETATGWQSVRFATPVSITAGTLYVASYYAPQSHYSDTQYALTNDVVAGHLTAPASGSVGGNGIYRYAAAPSFPVDSWHDSNYWVDVLFVAGSAPPPGPTCTVTATPTALSFPNTATSQALSLTLSDPSCTWTASTNQSWATVTPASGTGSASLQANVTANTGAARSATLTFTAANGSQAVSVAQAAAPNAGPVTSLSGLTYSFTVTATDTNGVASVKFYLDGVLKRTDSASPYTYTLDWYALPQGPHTVTAIATDSLGQTTAITLWNGTR